MSKEYDEYLKQHKENVSNALSWLVEYLPDILPKDPIVDINWIINFNHDASKTTDKEYDAYDAYFYGNRSYAVVQAFNRAWLHHIHNNPHHWQHWILINDDPGEGITILDIPSHYIIEMICDWWAFSWAAGDLTTIFTWYDEHKEYMKLSVKTRKDVEYILKLIKDKLEEHSNEKSQRYE